MTGPRALAMSAAVATLAVTSCSGGSPSTSPPASQAVVVGLINTEDAPVGSFPDLRRGAQAAVKYVDEQLGGVGGRHIDLVVCTTTGTPESSQACANRLLQRHPVAVIGGADLGAAASLPPLQAAGVPYVGGTPVATDALTSGGSYMFTGGTATEVLGEVAYATDVLHVTRLAAVYADVPGLLSQAVSLLRIIVRKKGVQSFVTVPVDPATPDLLPALTAAQRGHPQATLAVFPAQSCTRVVTSVASAAANTRMMYPSLCASERVLAAGGAAIDGSIVATGYTPYTDTADPDVAIYRAALARFDPTLNPSLLSQAGFSDVMILRSLLGQIAATAPTAAALDAQLRATRAHPGFMSHAFTCDRQQVPLLSSLCNAFVRISVVSHGDLRPVGSWVDTAAVAALAGS